MSGFEFDPADKIKFSGKKLGDEAATATLKMTNKLMERVVFKIKCTSNELFRIRPPVGAVKAEGNTTLVFNAEKKVPKSGKHYFMVYYTKCADEKKAVREVWSDLKTDPDGTKKMFVDFERLEEDDEKKEDKREEKKEEKKEEKREEKKEDKKDDKKDEKKEDKKGDNKEDKDEKKEDDKEDEKDDEKKE